MEIIDLIALGALIAVAVAVASGRMNWLLGLVAGLLLGALILGAIGLCAGHPKIDALTRGVLGKGKVIPFCRKQVEEVIVQDEDEPGIGVLLKDTLRESGHHNQEDQK